MLPTPTAYFRKTELSFKKALYLTTSKSLLQTYLSAKCRLAFQMPWQAAALTPSQLFFPDGSLALLICAPVFSLALICHEASSAVLTNQKKVHLATTSTPGQPHIYLGNCYYLAMGSGFLLKPWFPITCGHNCACKDTVFKRDLVCARADQRNTAKQRWAKWKITYCEKHDLSFPQQCRSCVTSRRTVTIQDVTLEFRVQGPAPALLCVPSLVLPVPQFPAIQKRNCENS